MTSATPPSRAALLLAAVLVASIDAQSGGNRCTLDADCQYDGCLTENGVTYPAWCNLPQLGGACWHGDATSGTHACAPPPAAWVTAQLSAQLVAQRYQGRFSYPLQEACSSWSETQPPPGASVDPHAGMDMSGRRTRRRVQAGAGAAQVRMNYLAAELVFWDYAPAGEDVIKGASFTPPSSASASSADGHGDHTHAGRRRILQGGGAHAMHMPGTWMANSRSPFRIGRHYLKMVFKEYTDHTFTALKPRSAEDEHLGLLGPTLRAEVGDTIQVVFRNHAPSGFSFSMHPHGVQYTKQNEGADYADGSDLTGDAVAPGACAYYQWEVPESAGPGPGDQSTKAWLYHGHVSETGDTNAGLVGAIIIGRAGATASATRKPTDVDREFVTLFSILDENDSPLLPENARLRLGLDPTLNASALKALAMDEEFKESNQMHAINGYVYGNLPGLTMTQGEVVRWHVMGLGNQEDIHTPHWHGQALLLGGAALAQRVDVVNILPATQLTLQARMENVGTWLYHCHVNHHIHAGMTALYTV